jgi:hypothetical protein
MAEEGDHDFERQPPHSTTMAASAGDEAELDKLKKCLQPHRELILPVNKFLEWDQKFYPGIIVGVITLEFLILWYVEPSVLTTLCVIGIVVTAVDFALPAITGHLSGASEWGPVKEGQFNEICKRILHAKQHFDCAKNHLISTKQDKPKLHYLGMIGAFATVAWLGSCFNNLFLAYLIVVGLALCPGVRKTGVLDKFTKMASEKFAALKHGKAKAN